MNQPKGFYLLSTLQMWKFFSHFGVRALLVLFMVEQLQYAEGTALGISAVFCGLVEICGIFGGVLADRLLGLKRATCIGSVLLGFGYLALLFEGALFPSLALIVLGAALFNSNITAVLGSVYTDNDPRREKGFTLFYMMQNLGALLSTLICGFVVTFYGFRAGFGVAASGMVIGNVLLLMNRRHMVEVKKIREGSIPRILLLGALVTTAVVVSMYFEAATLIVLPWIALGLFVYFALTLLKRQSISRAKLYQLFVYLGAMVLFFAAEDQCCSSLLLFAEQASERMIFGYELSSSMIIAINPIVILLFSGLVVGMKIRFRLAVPFTLVAVGFGLICLKVVSHSLFGIMGSIVLISLAELMIGPLVYSYSSEIASKGDAGLVMGLVPIGFSLAYLLSGSFGKMVASASSYEMGFAQIALFMMIAGCILEILVRRFSYDEQTAVC